MTLNHWMKTNYKKLNIFMFSGLLLFTSNVKAMGGWISGGGEFITDQQNPWFLQNTKQVNYCVLVDEPNFGMSEADVKNSIQSAIQSWKSAFTEVKSWGQIGTFSLKLGTQDFVYQNECDDSTDIRFQFGVLTAEQLEKVPNPKNHVGFSIRTQYDSVNMKGRGFVYISPEKGPLALAALKSGEPLWSSKNIFAGLYFVGVLNHELGHIFGLPHSENIFVMREDFPTDIVNNILQNGQGGSVANQLLSPSMIFPILVPSKIAFCNNCNQELNFSEIKDYKRKSKQYLSNKLKTKSSLDQSSAMDEFFGTVNAYYAPETKNKIKIYSGNTSKKVGEIDIQTEVGEQYIGQNYFFSLSTVYLSEKSFLLKESFARPTDIGKKFETGRLSILGVYEGIYTNFETKTKKPLKITLNMQTAHWIFATFSGEVKGKTYLDLERNM